MPVGLGCLSLAVIGVALVVALLVGVAVAVPWPWRLIAGAVMVAGLVWMWTRRALPGQPGGPWK